MDQSPYLKGYITIFLSLILAIVLSLILGTIESVRISAVRAQAERSLYLAADSVLASYIIPLMEDYHLFAVDGGSEKGHVDFCGPEEILTDYVNRNFPGNSSQWFGGEMSEVKINAVTLFTDFGMEPIKRQITEYMEKKIGYEAIEKIWANLTAGGQDLEAVKENQLGKLEAADQAAKEEEKVYLENEGAEPDRGDEPGKEVRDPRRSLKEILKSGILKIVAGDQFHLSKKRMDIDNSSFAVVEEQPVKEIMDFEAAGRFEEDMNENGKLPVFSEILNLGVKRLLLIEYASCFFRYATFSKETNRETALSYELEYLLFGHPLDEDNLASAVNKIIVIRMLLNSIYLMGNAEKKMEARGLAAILSLSIGMPFLEGVIHLLILMAWSYGEGILDCRQLIQGGKVPLLKTAESWKTSLANLADSIVEERIDDSQPGGLGYLDYIKLLLAFEDEDKICMRMMNLMEANIRLIRGYSGFCIVNSIIGFEYEANYHIPGFFGQKAGYHFKRKNATCY